MKQIITIVMAAMASATMGSVAEASPMLCSEYTRILTDAQKKGSLVDTVMNNKAILYGSFVSYGAYLQATGKKYSEISEREKNRIDTSLFMRCQARPSEKMWDVATSLGPNDIGVTDEAASSLHLISSNTGTITLTGKQIAAGVADSKTEMEQKKWWRENITGKHLALTGKILDVEEGSFSGYWVSLDIGRNVLLRCGLSDQWQGVAPNLRKGREFTCRGVGGRTWTSIFGIAFSMESDDPR